MMNGLYLADGIAVGVFGMALSAAFCDILWTRRKRILMAVSMAVILLFQGAIYLWVDRNAILYLYPLITHLPLILVLCVLSGKYFWSPIAALTAYLCCQLRRWLALLVVAVCSGDLRMQYVAQIVITVPLFLLLLHFVAPSVRSIGQETVAVQCRFGLIPAVGYGFDYLTRIYTDLLAEGAPVAVEFMPFVCSVAYLIFVLRTSEEKKLRSQLEQTQNSLNLQVSQAVREIASLRESQQRASIYRHDLRHHMQYLSSCIESGRLEQAQTYIHEVCSEIESGKVVAYCENEAANLILSAFAGRAQEWDIPIVIRADIPQNLKVAETDLCVLLSNALENALNACAKLKEHGAECGVEVDAYEGMGRLFLQIVNSCESGVRFENGVPVTDRPGHGVGVGSICAIVERYGGIYTFSEQAGKFTLRCSV